MRKIGTLSSRPSGHSSTVRSIHRRAFRILTPVALALATVMGILATASADAGPPAPPMTPVYDLSTAYWVLHDWGVSGTEQQVDALLADTCARMSNDQPSLITLQTSLSQRYISQFGAQGGNILAIASDTLCPQYQLGVAQLAWNEGARW